MSDYPMLISNKLHSFRNFKGQIYKIARCDVQFSYKIAHRIVQFPLYRLTMFYPIDERGLPGQK